MESITKLIGARIKAYRKQNDWSQSDLADRAGCHYTFIGAIERGEKVPTIETIYNICKALDLSMEILFKNIIDGKAESEMPNKYYDFANALPEREQKEFFALMEAIQAYHKNN